MHHYYRKSVLCMRYYTVDLDPAYELPEFRHGVQCSKTCRKLKNFNPFCCFLFLIILKMEDIE